MLVQHERSLRTPYYGLHRAVHTGLCRFRLAPFDNSAHEPSEQFEANQNHLVHSACLFTNFQALNFSNYYESVTIKISEILTHNIHQQNGITFQRSKF